MEETEKSRLQFSTSASNEAKKAVQKEAEQKKQSALKKLLQKKRYQKQYQAAKQGKAVKDAVLVNAQRFTEKAKAAVKELVAQNRNILLSIGVLVLLSALMATSLSSCARYSRAVPMLLFLPVIPVRMKIFMLRKMLM